MDIFRRPEFTHGVVLDTIERAAQTGRNPAIWTQIGVHSREARLAAEEAGLEYITNRCVLVEHKGFLG